MFISYKIYYILLIVILNMIIGEYSALDLHDNIKESMSRSINLSVDPCSDFYGYACGNWKNYISSLNYSAADNLQIIKEKVKKGIVELLSSNDGSVNNNQYSAANKAKRYYASCINAGESDTDGLTVILNMLKDYGDFPVLNPNWTEENFDWINVTSNLRLFGTQALIQEVVGPHWNNSNQSIIYFIPPKFEFITKTDLIGTSRNSEEYIFFYKRYIKQLFLKLGLRIRKAKAITDEVVHFEKQLARIIPQEEDIVPPDAIVVSDLSNRIPQIDWSKYLSNILESRVSIDLPVIIQEEYYKKLANLITVTEVRIVANYLLFKFLFHFKVGVEDKFTSEHCSQETNKKLGVITGALFARKYFQPEANEDVSNIVRNLKETFEDAINKTKWLDSGTKVSGLQKLQAMSTIVGLPEDILPLSNQDQNFKELQISSHDFYTNNLNIERFNTRKEHNSLFAPDNTVKWKFNPSDVNAFYKITSNSIFIPAGLLFPPIYQKNYPQYHSFAVLGSIVGHELIHGFDFEGKNYDAKGNVKNWWSTRSLIRYYEHLECIISQYNNYSLTDKHSSRIGSTSFSENIADNGGVRLAFYAYKNLLDNLNGLNALAEETTGTNMTSMQLFFFSFAQFWCSDDKLTSDSGSDYNRYSPNKYRVIGTLSNMPEFADEFKCAIGTKMNPIRKCALW